MSRSAHGLDVLNWKWFQEDCAYSYKLLFANGKILACGVFQLEKTQEALNWYQLIRGGISHTREFLFNSVAPFSCFYTGGCEVVNKCCE